MTILGQLGPTWGQLGLTWTLGLTWSFGYDHLGSTRANLGPTWVNLDPWANLDQTLEMSPAPWSAITMLITCYSHAPWSAITYHAHYLLYSHAPWSAITVLAESLPPIDRIIGHGAAATCPCPEKCTIVKNVALCMCG